MRLDKYLKVSRLIKRRTVANEACVGRVLLNDKVARASAEVKAGDVITIQFGNKDVKVDWPVTVQETVRKEEAEENVSIFSTSHSGRHRRVYCVRNSKEGARWKN